MKKVSLTYDAHNGIVYLEASQQDFIPKYLQYVLEYYGIPANVKIVFLEDIKNGEH